MHSYLLYIFMINLPYELMDKIRRLTYNPQPINMLNQIKMRNQFKKQLYDVYTLLYSDELASDPKAIENWIDNDITLCLNKEQPSMNGYTDHYYNILSRNIIFNTKEKIDRFSDICFTKIDSKTTINIYLGLLNTSDILELKKYIIKTYNQYI